MRVNLDKKPSSTPKGFIVIEGANGGGKSTLQRALAAYLEAKGKKVLLTREPGATKLGVELRSILLEGKVGKLTPRAELLLFAADRAEHVETVIRPAVNAGSLVISDRYFYSTSAFQGNGRGLDKATIEILNELAVASMLPDLVILLDLDAAIGLARIRERGGDSFEKEDLAFHRRIRDGFLALADTRPEPFLVIDATQSAAQVLATAKAALDKLWGL